jgi:hypothetical protein
MQDPKILQLLANNPLAPPLQSSLMAHLNEHNGFQYRINIEQKIRISFIRFHPLSMLET